ncbi:MAG: dihydropteroate synthase [Pseudomonadota bacterium]
MLSCGKYQFDLSRPLIMGIINLTPDSFANDGRNLSANAALSYAQQMIEDGADILDIGGESTRPGAAPVSVQQELDRVMPVIEHLCGSTVPVSIDTYKPEVMRAALAAGASMVNDINALQQEETLTVVAESNAAVCLMHKQGMPQTMQHRPHYQDVIYEVLQFLRARIASTVAAGIARERITIDPGFGFGKTLQHNLTLLGHLDQLDELDLPILVGMSRKSMLGTITGRDVQQRVHASVAAALLAVQRGARIVRVHDVAATSDALRVWHALQQANGEQQ